eukprot:9777412-Alexandrium_andersonii.AAC.1
MCAATMRMQTPMHGTPTRKRSSRVAQNLNANRENYTQDTDPTTPRGSACTPLGTAWAAVAGRAWQCWVWNFLVELADHRRPTTSPSGGH